MIELVFVACLAASPSDCEERNLIYDGITALTCIIAAQRELATWAEQNPGHTIAGWSCRRPQLDAREI
jgi:hypothetical protein